MTASIRIQNLAAFLCLESDTNFGQPEDWDGSWENYDPTYQVPGPEEFTARAGDFLDAMEYVFPRISDTMDSEELMTVFYDAGKSFYGKANLRTFFRDIYLVLTGRPDGARIGLLVDIWGCDQFRERISDRIGNILEN